MPVDKMIIDNKSGTMALDSRAGVGGRQEYEDDSFGLLGIYVCQAG
jgi:hypothetical protein